MLFGTMGTKARASTLVPDITLLVLVLQLKGISEIPGDAAKWIISETIPSQSGPINRKDTTKGETVVSDTDDDT